MFSFKQLEIVPVLYFPALWVGIIALEHFFWFELNWRPDDVGRVMMPTFYIAALVIVVALLIAQDFLIARQKDGR
jgi:hypothetical protein